MPRVFFITGLFALAAACAVTKSSSPPEKLYFALEVRRDGVVVGKPKLLGETGIPLRVERRRKGASTPDYALRLLPKKEGEGFGIDLDVEVQEAGGHQQLSLLHGQERKLQLGRYPGELDVSLTVMRVDSPEFRALMDWSTEEDKDRSVGAI